MRIHKVNQNYLFGAGGVMLAGILGVMLFPAMPEGAHAEDVSQSAGTKVNLTVQPVIAVSAADNAVSVDVTPTQGGTFEKNSTELSVSTNNETGYSLYLSTANGKSTLASLNPSVTDMIGAVSGTVEESGFGDNTWGYNLSEGTPSGNLTYQAVPGDSTVQKGFGSEGPTASDTYTLTFGTKVNTSLPSGTYSNQVVVSVVANPAYVPNLTQISNMQDMTTEICNASTVGQTNRLTDTRDGKLYWVAKLADKQCWMTQNLDFDIPEGGLTNENGLAAKTDLPDGTVWDSSSDYAPQATTGSPFSDSSYTGAYSFDPGMYVNNNPTAWFSCDDYWSGGSCLNWTEVSSMTAMTEERTDGTIIDGNTYDAHYLAGNYYQYDAATAGTGCSLHSYDDATTSTACNPEGVDDATGSICPKGWTLPSDSNNDYSQLIDDAYNISDLTGAAPLTKSPLYFIPAGHVTSGSLYVAGRYGYYWSSTAFLTEAGHLYFYKSRVYPSNYGLTDRHDGHPVRCLAR